MINKFKRLKVIVFLLRLISPGFSHCTKCGLPWNWCEHKAVQYSMQNYTFSTCQYCWNHSDLETLKECYTKTYHMQERSGGYYQQLDHTLEHLLNCVSRDYNEDIKEIRNKKIIKLKGILKTLKRVSEN